MTGIDFEQEISDRGFAGKLIRRKARQLAGRHGFGRSDGDDIAQELRLELFRSLPSFDACKGDWRAFATAIVERSAGALVRRQCTAKRGGRRPTRSLSTTVATKDGPMRLADLIGVWHQEAVTGQTSRSHTQHIDTVHDVDQLLSTLPEDLRYLCMQLKTKTLAQITRETGMPRTTLRSRMDRIREHFEQAGLTRCD